MNFEKIRNDSIPKVHNIGLPIPKALPLLEIPTSTKNEDGVLARLFCLHALAAVAYGFDREKAKAWIVAQGLNEELTGIETQFMQRSIGNATQYMLQIEGMWAFAWALQIIEKMEFASPCSETFVRILPNLKAGEDTGAIRKKARLRSPEEIAIELDLAYCMHWGINQCRILNVSYPEKVFPEMVIERRRALEWIWGNEPWDVLPMDT